MTQPPFEDDCPDGGGQRPTKEQAEKVRDYLISRKRPATVKAVFEELSARNYVVSKATVGRLIPFKPRPPLSPVRKAEHRVTSRRARNRVASSEAAKQPPLKAPAPPPEVSSEPAKAAQTISAALAKVDPRFSLEALTKADATSTALAILENRERMALNIIIMRTMAMYPERMIVDMRCTAALVDALTMAAKLSGGASIDITVPTSDNRPHGLNGAHGNGEMKDVTPTVINPLAEDFAKWRNLRKTNGQGA